MTDHNGTPPYTFRYYCYMAQYDERHETLEEAVYAWSAGEDNGNLFGQEIADAPGTIVVSHDEWFGTLWHACDDGTLAATLADPQWRAKHRAIRVQEAADRARCYEEARYAQEQQIIPWHQMIASANHRTRSNAIFSLRRTWIDVGRKGFDPTPSSRQIEGRAYPSVQVRKSEMPLYPNTTEEEIVAFLERCKTLSTF